MKTKGTKKATPKGKSLKKAVIIGISGAPGSFSEEAGRRFAAHVGLKNPTLAYLVSVENVLAALEAGKITYGIFPIENSNGGIVIEAVHAMAKHRFSIKKLFEIEVRMCLLSRKGTKMSDIKQIVSHDQALKQCRHYLKRHWPKVKLKEYADTALSAADLAKGSLSKNTAVIASAAAAKRYKLDILEEGIQDLKYNYTSFVAATI